MNKMDNGDKGCPNGLIDRSDAVRNEDSILDLQEPRLQGPFASRPDVMISEGLICKLVRTGRTERAMLP